MNTPFGMRFLSTAAIAACTLGLHPALAQTTASGTDSATLRPAARLSRADLDFMKDIARANLAEIATGRMASEKARHEQIKRFGATMVEEHAQAQSELQALATRKGVELPDAPDIRHRTDAIALRGLSGEAFDKRYISKAGVADHGKAHTLLQQVQREARDADLRAYADRTLRLVHGHLMRAQELARRVQ